MHENEFYCYSLKPIASVWKKQNQWNPLSRICMPGNMTRVLYIVSFYFIWTTNSVQLYHASNVEKSLFRDSDKAKQNPFLQFRYFIHSNFILCEVRIKLLWSYSWLLFMMSNSRGWAGLLKGKAVWLGSVCWTP